MTGRPKKTPAQLDQEIAASLITANTAGMTAKQLDAAARKASKRVTCKRCQGRGTFMTDRVCYGCGGHGTHLVHTGDSKRLAKLAHIAQVEDLLREAKDLKDKATKPGPKRRYAAEVAEYEGQLVTLRADLEAL